MPTTFPPLHLFSTLLDPAASHSHVDEPGWLVLAGAVVPLAGLGVAWVLWGRPSPVMREIPGQAAVIRFARTGEGIDVLYDRLFVQPFRFLTWLTRHDILDYAITGAGRLTRTASTSVLRARTAFLGTLTLWGTSGIRWADHLMGQIQNGRVRWYAAWIAGGLCVALTMALLS